MIRCIYQRKSSTSKQKTGQVLEYRNFSGSIITKDGIGTKEIKRIIMGKSAMPKLERILRDKNLTKKTIKIAETLAFPIVTYVRGRRIEKNLMLLNYGYG